MDGSFGGAEKGNGAEHGGPEVERNEKIGNFFLAGSENPRFRRAETFGRA